MKPVAKSAIKNFVLVCSNNEEYERRLTSLIRASKSEEWKVVVELLWNIKNNMASELVASDKLTDMDATQKDIVQRVYHEVNEIIDFLTMPARWIGKKGLLVRALGTVKKGAQNGRGNSKTS